MTDASTSAVGVQRRPKLDDMEHAIMLHVGSLHAWRSYYQSTGRDLHPEQAWHLASLEETLVLFDKLRACRAEVIQIFRKYGLEHRGK